MKEIQFVKTPNVATIFHRVVSDKDLHFTGAIAQNAYEDANITGLVVDRARITNIAIKSRENLKYYLLFWAKDTFGDADVDVDTYVGHVELPLPLAGLKITQAATDIYYMNASDADLEYEDLDGTKELHVSLMNLSAAAKTAGAAGAVSIEFDYIER